MKTSVPYSLKRIFAGVLLVAVPVFTSCEKDPVKPDNNNGNGGNTQPQRTEEFIYNSNLEFYRNDTSVKIPRMAFTDTAAKYGADQNVNQIHITPASQYMCETSTETGMVGRANDLNAIYNASNNKLSGQNTTLVLDEAAFNNQTVRQILQDKLKIELLQR